MRKSNRNCTLHLALCFQIAALGPLVAQDKVSVECVSLANNKEYKFSVSSDRIEKTPEWIDGKDVPYPAFKAKAAAIQEFHKLLPNASEYDLTSISLEKTEDRWYYRVQFLKLKDHPAGLVTPFLVVILLDGSVVEPVITPLTL